MTVHADLLATAYLDWIRGSVSAEALSDEMTELTTPFVDRHNDHLQIYAERRSPDLFLLTDDGYILAELKSSGVRTQGQKREELVRELLSAHGVTVADSELQVQATTANLGQRAHSLIQAMLSIDDMFMLAQPQVQAMFFDDVANFLDDHEIRYSPRVKFSGKSGLDHLIDFVIPRSKEAPERVLQVINAPRRDRIESHLFAANDTRAARAGTVDYYAILNDSRRPVSPDIISAFNAYDITAEPWSEREAMAERLAA